MTLEQYIHNLGLLLEDLKIDQNGKIYVIAEDYNPRADSFYREINIPEEYQTLKNVKLLQALLTKHD